MITVQSPYSKDHISVFDNEESYPDIDFVIPGLDKPLRLCRNILAPASTMFTALFKNQMFSCCTFNGETQNVQWIFDTTMNNATYRGVLVKWLRFCYGEDQIFNLCECPAAMNILYELQLSCMNEMMRIIENYMIETVKNDVNGVDDVVVEYMNNWMKNKAMDGVEKFVMELPTKQMKVFVEMCVKALRQNEEELKRMKIELEETKKMNGELKKDDARLKEGIERREQAKKESMSEKEEKEGRTNESELSI